MANVVRVLLLLLLLVDELSFGDKALATAKVVSMSPPKALPPLDELPPFIPPFKAKAVATGELPNELMTTASVVDIRLLLSIATAANGFTLPLVTPESRTIFFNGSSR